MPCSTNESKMLLSISSSPFNTQDSSSRVKLDFAAVRPARTHKTHFAMAYYYSKHLLFKTSNHKFSNEVGAPSHSPSPTKNIVLEFYWPLAFTLCSRVQPLPTSACPDHMILGGIPMEMKGQSAVGETFDSLSAFVKSTRRAELQHNPPMDECLEWNVEINLNLQGKCTFQTDPGEITFTAEAETEGVLLHQASNFNKG